MKTPDEPVGGRPSVIRVAYLEQLFWQPLSLLFGAWADVGDGSVVLNDVVP